MQFVAATILFLTLSTAGANPLKAANDNRAFPSKCALLLVEGGSLNLTAQDGQLVFNSRRREVYESHDAELRRLAKADDRVGFGRQSNLQKEELNLLPNASLSPDGVMIEKRDLSNQFIRLTVRSGPELSPMRSVDIARAEWLGHMGQVGPNGHYVLLLNEESTKIKLVSTLSGKVLLDRSTDDMLYGITAKFAGKNHITINEKGQLETYEISEDGLKHLFTHYLGSNDVDIAEQRLMIPILFDGLGSVQYLPKHKSYLAFYYGPEPLLVKPGRNSTFTRHFFEPAKVEFTPTGDYSQFPKGLENVGAELEKPRYSPNGLVSQSENLLIATRTQGRGPTWLGLIDIFSIPGQKYLRTIPIPVTPYKMALSPNERFLAVSSNSSEGVRIYDLNSRSTKPYIVIRFDNKEGSQLTFVSDNTILAGSANYGELYRFELPLP